MIDAICIGIFIFIIYSLFGLIVGAFLDTAYDMDMPVGCMFVWPFIVICISILDCVKIVQILIAHIRRR